LHRATVHQDGVESAFKSLACYGVKNTAIYDCEGVNTCDIGVIGGSAIPKSSVPDQITGHGHQKCTLTWVRAQLTSRLGCYHSRLWARVRGPGEWENCFILREPAMTLATTGITVVVKRGAGGYRAYTALVERGLRYRSLFENGISICRNRTASTSRFPCLRGFISNISVFIGSLRIWK
jgi:hypothetical protein